MKDKVIIILLMILSMAITSLTHCGIYQLLKHPKRIEQLNKYKAQDEEIVMLRSHIIWLKAVDAKCIEIVLAVEQILNQEYEEVGE